MTESKASPQLWATVTIAVAVIACLGTIISAVIAKIPISTPSASTSMPVVVVITETSSASTNQETENHVAVTATKGWQTTGVKVSAGNELVITVTSGSWTSEKGKTAYNNGEGNPLYICAENIASYKCVEPMPDFPIGGLVGQVGSQIFWLGNGATIRIEQSGTLQLRINDGDDGLYDNDGTLQIKVVVQ